MGGRSIGEQGDAGKGRSGFYFNLSQIIRAILQSKMQEHKSATASHTHDN